MNQKSESSLPEIQLSSLEEAWRLFNQRRQDELLQIASQNFKEATRIVFEACPEIAAIRWKAYIPYFNDGEPCVYRICDPLYKLASQPSDGADRDGFEEMPVVSPETDRITMIYHGFICSMKKQMQEMYGDNVKITVTPTDIQVDSYTDHD